MIEQVIPKDAIGRELRIGDTVIYCQAIDSQVYLSKRIICDIGMTTIHGKDVPYIKDDYSSRDGIIISMNKVVLISHAPIKGEMTVFDDDYCYME